MNQRQKYRVLLAGSVVLLVLVVGYLGYTMFEVQPQQKAKAGFEKEKYEEQISKDMEASNWSNGEQNVNPNNDQNTNPKDIQNTNQSLESKNLTPQPDRSVLNNSNPTDLNNPTNPNISSQPNTKNSLEYEKNLQKEANTPSQIDDGAVSVNLEIRTGVE